MVQVSSASDSLGGTDPGSNLTTTDRTLIGKLAKLNEASRAMTACFELPRLLDTILRLVEEVFELDTCAVLLVDPASGEQLIEPGQFALARDKGGCGRVAG